jgi:chemotaxis protein CheX
MSTQVIPTAPDLSDIVAQVWSSYLDPEGLHPLVAKGTEPTVVDVVASVSISGGWSGHVVVSCSEGAAKHAAGAFLMTDAADVTAEDVADVMGELANIVGGNVKSMLPASSFVSLPHVVVAPDSTVHWPACVQICELAGTWHGESVSISMWQANENGSKSS